MIAKVYNHNEWHHTDTEPVELEGYIGAHGDFVVEAYDLLQIGGTCHNDECFCGPWCSLRAELPDGSIVPVIA